MLPPLGPPLERLDRREQQALLERCWALASALRGLDVDRTGPLRVTWVNDRPLLSIELPAVPEEPESSSSSNSGGSVSMSGGRLLITVVTDVQCIDGELHVTKLCIELPPGSRVLGGPC